MKAKQEKKARKGKGYVQKKLHSSVVQTHHITYNPPFVVRIYKGEHWIAHQILRRKRISKGFIVLLEHWLAEHKEQGVDLT